jgi:hypothetical protein
MFNARRVLPCVPAILAACGLIPSTASAEPVQVVLTIAPHAPTSPKSAIPGDIPGGAGTQSDPRFNNFNVRAYHSPSGSNWIVGASTNLSPSPNVIVAGSGLNVLGGALAARETLTTTVTGDPVNLNLLQSIPRINDAGQWALASSSTAGAGRIIKWDGTHLTTLFQAGDVLPGGETDTCGGTFAGANIALDGSVSFEAIANFPGSATSGPYGVYTTAGGGSAIITAGQSVPLDQANDQAAAWVTVNTLSSFSQDATGANWLALGKVGPDVTADLSVVVNNQVKIQKGVIIAGSGFAAAVSSITDAQMEANGDWYARGANADSSAWIVRNGTVVAASGQSITPGSSEHWKPNTLFIDVKGNPNGNFVITGTTDNTADLARTQVLVLNGTRVLARTSDPVDLNADGTFTGGLFLFTPSGQGTYCADGYYYFAARLKNVQTATTSALGPNSSFLRVLACPADFNGSGNLNVQDIFDYLSAWFAGDLGADFNRSGSLNVQDIFDFLSGWFSGC